MLCAEYSVAMKSIRGLRSLISATKFMIDKKPEQVENIIYYQNFFTDKRLRYIIYVRKPPITDS